MIKARQICYLILLVVSAGLWDWFPGNISEENLSSNLHPPNISEEEASFSYSETNKKHLFYLTKIFCYFNGGLVFDQPKTGLKSNEN